MKIQKPEIEFIKFDAQDIIVTSGEPGSRLTMPYAHQDPVYDTTEKSLTKAYGGLNWNTFTPNQ